MAKKVYLQSYGKWLSDIAKYITTAVILTSIFSDLERQWMLYVFGVLAAATTLICGLLLLKNIKED